MSADDPSATSIRAQERRARLLGGLIPIVALIASVVLAIWLPIPHWWPAWAPQGQQGEAVALTLFLVLVFPVLLLVGIAWEVRARPAPAELVAELSSSPIDLHDDQVRLDDDVLGSCSGGFITSTFAHYGTVLVVEAVRTGLRMRRTRWPAFRSADIEELSIRWSAIRFVREVAIGRPRPAVAFVLEARGRRFAIWAAPKQSYKMAGLLDRRQDGDFET